MFSLARMFNLGLLGRVLCTIANFLATALGGVAKSSFCYGYLQGVAETHGSHGGQERKRGKCVADKQSGQYACSRIANSGKQRHAAERQRAGNTPVAE